MEHQEIKSKVGKKTTEIWEAYQEVLAELKSKEVGPQSTVEVSSAKKKEQALNLAKKTDVEAWAGNLEGMIAGLKHAKEVFDDVNMAIEAKKAELRDVHKLEYEANALFAVVEAKNRLIEQKEEDLNRLIEESQAKAKEVVANANAEADRIVDEATETARLTEANSKEKLRVDEQSRKRMAEEWDYNFKRNCRAKVDEVEDELKAKLKVLSEREAHLVEREDAALELEERVEKLTSELVQKDQEAQEKVNAAVEETKKKEARSWAVQKSIIENSYQSKIDVLEAKNGSLMEQLRDLLQRLEKAEARVMDANNKVTAIATGALQAAGDKATIARVAEVAAGSQKK